MGNYYQFDLELPELDHNLLLMQDLVDGYAGGSISSTPQFVRYVCDDQTPSEVKNWCEKADNLILHHIGSLTTEPVEFTNRQFLIYMPGNEGHRLHMDQIYMGPLGQIEPFVTLLYANDFSGGELVYGDKELSLKKHRLLLLPTVDKIPHKVNRSNGIRVVYRPTITLVEPLNEVIQFSKFLVNKLGHDSQSVIKRCVLEYLGREEVPEIFLEDSNE